MPRAPKSTASSASDCGPIGHSTRSTCPCSRRSATSARSPRRRFGPPPARSPAAPRCSTWSRRPSRTCSPPFGRWPGPRASSGPGTMASRTAAIERRPRVALLEWLDPPFSCGHWNPELVRLAGGVEGLGEEGRPSRTLSWDEVLTWEPEVVFIACCGFGTERTLADLPALWLIPGWRNLPAVRAGRVYVTDGSHYFSRPGPRLVDSLEILAHTLHPEVHPLPAGLAPPVRVTGSERAIVPGLARTGA